MPIFQNVGENDVFEPLFVQIEETWAKRRLALTRGITKKRPFRGLETAKNALMKF